METGADTGVGREGGTWGSEDALLARLSIPCTPRACSAPSVPSCFSPLLCYTTSTHALMPIPCVCTPFRSLPVAGFLGSLRDKIARPTLANLIGDETSPVTVDPNATVAAAAATMRSRGVTAVIVVPSSHTHAHAHAATSTTTAAAVTGPAASGTAAAVAGRAGGGSQPHRQAHGHPH
ncbi:unnamed protein product, partial [Closterium sp. Yama58-4]